MDWEKVTRAGSGIFILAVIAALISIALCNCSSHQPPIVYPLPTPTPKPVPIWEKMGQEIVGEKPARFKRAEDRQFSISDVWASGRTVAEHTRRVALVTREERFIPFDTYYRKGIENSKKAMREWMQEIRDWNHWSRPECEYSLYDSIMTSCYIGILQEYNFDTSGAWYYDETGKWHWNYHYGRRHPELVSDDLYRKLVMKFLAVVIEDWNDWQRKNDYKLTNPVVAVTIENEPRCCEKKAGKDWDQEFTLNMYLKRLRIASKAIKKRWPQIDIQAGDDDVWSVEAWKTGKVDVVGFHFIPSLNPRWGGYPAYYEEWKRKIKVFDKAKIPRQAILPDEVMTDEHMKITLKWARQYGLRGWSWVTMFTDKMGNKKCGPPWTVTLDPARTNEPEEALLP